MRTRKYFYENFYFFCPKKVEKTTPESCILMAVGRFFFSAAPTAQNSPELYFRFINSFIQSSLLRSLLCILVKYAGSQKVTPLTLMTLLSMPQGTDINFLELPNIFLQLGYKFVTHFIHNSKKNIDQNCEESMYIFW